MSTQITSFSMSVESIYDQYSKFKLIVNRKYQRKLVWTREEKIAFIDSIYKHYSAPLFLFANITLQNGENGYEIIDGMQRLNAICSFIESEIPIIINGENRYFDLSIKASTNTAKSNGLLIQKTPVLSHEECMDILSYQLPISAISNSEDKQIEEIFRRINSFGRQLSKQEIRQAGAIGAFSDLVRKIASKIRNDSSPSDILELNKMKEISLSNRELNYGININDIFWTKQKIITVPNMRVSRDEELIAWILTYILLGSKVAPSSTTLDRIYKYDLNDIEGISSDVETSILKYGEDNLQTWFIKVFDELITILDKTHSNFRELIFQNDKGEGLVRSFQVIFLALYDLIINNNLHIIDYKGLADEFKGIGNIHLNGISTSEWDATYRHSKILAVKGVIQKYFAPNIKTNDDAKVHWVTQLETLLSQSKIEGSQFDFKIGFHSLDDQKFSEKLVHKIIKTLTSMANKGPHEKGYVIVGVADKMADAQKFKEIYGKDFGTFRGNEFLITGIQEEVKKYKHGYEEYLSIIKSIIKKEPIKQEVIDNILSTLKLVSYYGRDILIFEIESGDEPILYDNDIYIRSINSVEKVGTTTAIMGVAKRFQKSI